MHYADLTEKVAGYLRNIPFPYDLIVSVTDPAAVEEVRNTISERVPLARLTMVPVTNKGRDVKPFYTDAAHLLTGYDVIGHIHGKKSLFNNGATAGWLDYLLDCLMGSEATVHAAVCAGVGCEQATSSPPSSVAAATAPTTPDRALPMGASMRTHRPTRPPTSGSPVPVPAWRTPREDGPTSLG